MAQRLPDNPLITREMDVQPGDYQVRVEGLWIG